MTIFFMGFLQVFLISCNTYFIAQRNFAGATIMGFLISFVWSGNVKKVALGTMQDRVKYSLGASMGSLLGLVAGNAIQRLF